MLSGLPLLFVLPCLFVLGTIIGSFLNVAVHRLPAHDLIGASWRGLWSPPSRCPQCLAPILLRDNIPIFGWIKLRGRCRSCDQPISIRYPAVELFNGLLLVVVYLAEIGYAAPVAAGFPMESASRLFVQGLSPLGSDSSAWFSHSAVLHWRFLFHVVLLETLLVASLIDWDIKEIPDSVTVPAMVCGLAGGTLGCVYIVPLWFQNSASVEASIIKLTMAWSGDGPLPGWLTALGRAPNTPAWPETWPLLHGFTVSLAGLVVGGGVIWLVRIAGGWVLKQEAMGFGDVTLMAAIGSFIGWQPVLVVFFVAPMLALVYGLIRLFFDREREVSYGPFLGLATLLLLSTWPVAWPLAAPVFESGPLFLLLLAIGTTMFIPLLILTRTVRRLIGFPDPPLEGGEARWRSADQLTYFAGETVDRGQGRWRDGPDRDWPGVDAGRGQGHESHWRG